MGDSYLPAPRKELGRGRQGRNGHQSLPCPSPGPRLSPAHLPKGVGKGASEQQLPKGWGWMRESMTENVQVND